MSDAEIRFESVEELEAWLAQQQAEAEGQRSRPVFFPPKASDPGFPERQARQMAFQRKQMARQEKLAAIQAQMEQQQRKLTEANEEVEVAAVTVAAAQLGVDNADGDDQFAEAAATLGRETERLREAKARVQAETQGVFDLMAQLNEVMEQQGGLVDEQIEYVLPNILAIKDPPATPGGSWSYRPKPLYNKDKIAAFEAEARELLRQSSQDEFNQMIAHANGQGQAATVPPKNGGR